MGEQGAVQRSMRNANHVSESNSQLKEKNTALEEAKKQLEQDEEALTQMYEIWIEDDSEDLKITKDQIREIQDKITAVKSSQANHENALAEKEIILNKEDVLSDLHLQL